jgi:hypothetical protein
MTIETKACGTCGQGTLNEHGTINCQYDDGEAQNKSNYCDEWCEKGSLKARLSQPVSGESVSEVPSPDNEQATAPDTPRVAIPLFNVYDLAGYAQSEADAIRRCFEHKQAGREGEPGFDLSVRFADDGMIKARVRVKLPNDVKFDLPETGYIRENGTFRLMVQQNIFDHTK